MTRAPHIPKDGTKQYLLLKALLEGVRVDPFIALMDYNLPTLHARASELRKLGWPVRTMTVPHPKLPGEKVTVYFFDAHFRAWMFNNPGQSPASYADNDGRGKFVVRA